MKKFLLYALIAALAVSCAKENNTPQPQLRLLKIIETTWEGTLDVAVYNYDSLNRLKDIKYKTRYNDNIEVFNYGTDGKLSSFESNIENYHKITFYYSGDKIDYLVQTYLDINQSLRNDTTFYTYDPAGKSISVVSRNEYIYAQYHYLLDEKSRVIVATGDGIDSILYTWDTKGNLTTRIDRGWDDFSHEYHVYVAEYKYDSNTNFINAIPYPKEWQFLSSLSPDPKKSSNNCTSGTPFYFRPIIGTGPNVFGYPNTFGYPTRISSGETRWELVYGEY